MYTEKERAIKRTRLFQMIYLVSFTQYDKIPDNLKYLLATIQVAQNKNKQTQVV